ncbi:flagellar hook-basal body protein [Kurthia huakuii]|uniref:flagellar hook-basal body protein n=1 Tax=Kurthia huakuii TaxID=1421019 RepID=UPI0004962321|nr:flagellar hook-basal body protein [Kurthia huakuii]MBM7698859.1 flagellar basal-body rod protein FlgG [Kurthia huakuii]
MFKGVYTATTGMIAQQRRTEMLSNNIANASTPGYKADQSTVRAFPNMLLSAIEKNGKANLQNGFNPMAAQKIGTIGTGVYMQETIPDYTQGQLVETGLKSDVALVDEYLPVRGDDDRTGGLYFRLQTDGAEAYTRNGNFTVDSEGSLVTTGGNYVLSTTGEPIQVTSDDYTITEDGRVLENNELIAQLDVAYVEDPDTLIKQDNGLYYSEDGNDLASAYDDNDVAFSMRQGYIEQSNVDAGSTMTEMMSAYRSFEANQKMLQAYDRSMDKAVNEIGKV